MGYYTRYTLEIVSGDDYRTDYEEEIGQLSDYGPNMFSGEIKWYKWEEHMREYSTRHPETVFKLSGEGEEAGDLWHAYFQNGKMQYAKAQIIFEPFDPEKLQ